MILFQECIIINCIAQNTCHKVAALKHAEGKKQWISICYDECVRKSWSQRAYSNDPSLDIAVEADKVNQSLLEQAVVKYDSIEKVMSFICCLLCYKHVSIALWC